MGEDLKRDQTISFPFLRTIDRDYDDRDLIFHDKLIYSENKVAPTYPGSDVQTSCILRSDFRHVNKKSFKKITGVDGKHYLQVHYNLALSTAEANMKFSLIFNGSQVGSVEATYT